MRMISHLFLVTILGAASLVAGKRKAVSISTIHKDCANKFKSMIDSVNTANGDIL